ncbi:ATP-binding protein [Pseudofrankia asymbiotica]|uniref:Histidine kinase/HSP90-like ATPase domain-containing protein n=1 Tax=Pseudofrankia asymbiotica TaxID=1834516 RepID=A0A1V2I3B2_9ACTN|nr:ATP-binding protein [Pseudofrankia asymbiotica]ONH24879.1 hypothetical protein BL253_28815 [Pseudofrankia asymbiotica]
MTAIGPPGTPAVTRLPPTRAAVPVVRKRTVQTLRYWSVAPEAIETAELIVSELVTNAVKISRPDDEFIAVRLSATGDTVVVEVWSRPDATELHAIHPADDVESGRGLSIVEALATRWDAYRAESGGVVVWARFPGAIVPAARADRDATPLPTREARPVPEPLWPAPDPQLPSDLPLIEFSTDPAVVARVAERLRALFPWHERHATDAHDAARMVAALHKPHGATDRQRLPTGRD